MKLKFLLLLTPILCCVACEQKNPIVFSKKTNMSEVTLSLDTNGTFVHSAQSTVGARFSEKGTYSVQDSVLILDYEFDSYAQGCYEIPLENDTFLIMNYGGKSVLFPTIKSIPESNWQFESNEQLMQKIVSIYSSFDFEKYVGTRYFATESGDISLIYNGKANVSPYYDSLLK